MPNANTHRFWLSSSLLLWLLFAVSQAQAQQREPAALRKIGDVMTVNYAAGEWARAEAILLGTDKACAEQCSPAMHARIWLYIGSVRGTGARDQARAAAAFEQALKAEPSLGPDPAYTNEATLQTYQATRAQLSIAGEPAKNVTLELPPPAAPPPAPLPPPPPMPQLVLFDQNRPMTLEYRDGQPIPEGYRLEERPRRGLMMGGAITTGVVYGFALLVASANDFGYTTGWLILPVLGPWMAMATYSCSAGDLDCEDTREGYKKGMIILGVGQAIGVGIFTVGSVAKRKLLVRSELTSHVSIGPIRVGRDGHGVGVYGQF